jgi:hypothetical protein
MEEEVLSLFSNVAARALWVSFGSVMGGRFWCACKVMKARIYVEFKAISGKLWNCFISIAFQLVLTHTLQAKTLPFLSPQHQPIRQDHTPTARTLIDMLNRCTANSTFLSFLSCVVVNSIPSLSYKSILHLEQGFTVVTYLPG